MSKRQTSIDAYNKIKEEGLLSRRRWEIYDVVFKNGPMTSAEAFRKLILANTIRNITQSRARFTELRDSGVFQECGTKVCSVTGMTVILWDVTSRLPIKAEKPTTHKCKACGGKGYIKIQQLKMF